MVLLTGVNCQSQESEFEAVPLVSFWVELDISKPINADYKLVRVLVVDGENQIGEVSFSEPNMYKITLPESYIGKPISYVAEFTKINSVFDNSNYDQPNDKTPNDRVNSFIKSVEESFEKSFDKSLKDIVISLLKSRYYEIPGGIPYQSNTSAVKLTICDVTNLKLGYGPGGIKIADIQGAPSLYLINIDTKQIDDYGFTSTFGIVAAKDSGPKGADDVDSGYGFAAPETDWLLLLKQPPNTSFIIWFTLNRDTDAATVSCRYEDLVSCTYQGCLCNSPYMFVDKNVDELPENGSTINIVLTESDLCECKESSK
jgi:hypothetical protein